MIKVSIIVPVYRVAAYLNRCVESLTRQTLREIEIILVDDGSPDECPAMCDAWAEKDARIRVIHQENQGLGFARNSGLAQARGEFIGFVDSDDYVQPDMFSRLYNAAQECGAQIAMSGLCCVGGIMVAREHEVQNINCFAQKTVFSGKAEIDRLMLDISGAPPGEREDSKYGFSSVKNIYRASVCRAHDLRFLSEREVMSEDVFFLLDFLAHTDCAVGIPGAYYCYCRNDASLSKSYRADRFCACQRLIDGINARLAERMPTSEYERYTDRLLQAYARAACMQEIQFARQNGISEAELSRRLRDVCKSERLQRVLRRYPWWKLPKMQAVFAMTMRFSWIRLQKLLVRMKSRG